IPIPDFWSTFLLVYAPGMNDDEIQLSSHLRHNVSFVESAELDRAGKLADATANDPIYNKFEYQGYDYSNTKGQFSLWLNAAEWDKYNGIDVEGAWTYTTGKSFVKIGIFDSGLYLTHQDF